jgi:uncharacterized membrane protein
MLPQDGIEGITKKNVELIDKIESASNAHRTVGDRVADVATKVVGSWTFLIVQGMLLILWMILNIGGWWRAWDPYPFILLNLVLSFQSAFATPIILMSQNRQARLDERRNKLDLQINLLAEQENTEQLKLLRRLCEKAGIELSESEEGKFEQSIDPNNIVRQITGQSNRDR